jgi:hypothetical protein
MTEWREIMKKLALFAFAIVMALPDIYSDWTRANISGISL